MYDAKTKPTAVSIPTFVGTIDDSQKRKDCQALIKLMEGCTGEKPKMWGPSMIGFGKYHYKYESGHEGDSFLAGFSPRKQNISLYLLIKFNEHEDLLQKLGKFKTAKSCLYVKRLEDINLAILKELINRSLKKIPGRPC